MSYLDLLKFASPEAVLVITALAVLTIGLITGRRAAGATVSGDVAEVRPSGSRESAVAGSSFPSLATAIGLLVSIAAILTLPPNCSLFGGMLVISPLTSLFKIICVALAFFTVLIAHGGNSLRRNRSEYLAMVLLATIGLMLLVGSEELLMIFIGLELTGLSLYVLTAFDKNDTQSAEAGLKYFLFGSTASAFTLFGLSFVYGLSGTTGLAAIAEKLGTAPVQPLLAVGIVMTLVGFAFKIAAAPFHLWAPDAYQAAPIPSAAFIASGSKVASFVVLGKILLVGLAPLHGSANWHAMIAGWTPLLAALAALSILIGNLVALAQTNVRRLLAYSAVAHAGYTLLGLVTGARDGFAATLFYTTIYAVTLIGAFGVVALVRRETGGDDFAHFAGLRARSPLLAFCMTVFLLSLAGLPPLAGFFGKFYLFSTAFRAGDDHGLLWLVALALFGSLISLYYYLVVLKLVLVDESKPASTAMKIDWLQRATIATLAGAVLVLGVMPSALVSRIVSALQ
jgi:NADH-quinone oxidoreductase subunit N